MANLKSAIQELQQFVTEGRDDPKTAPLPTPAEVLYEGPLPGAENRKCSNCVFWVEPYEQCSLMEAQIRVLGTNICGLHVGGAPSKKRLNLPGLVAVEPKRVGLKKVSEGTACSNCVHYTSVDEEDGTCAAIAKKQRSDTPPRAYHVHPKGCCTRWSMASGVIPDPDQVEVDPNKTTPERD